MAKSPAPVSEIGYVKQNDLAWDHWDTDERVAALQWPQSIQTYGRMSVEDGRVASLLAAIKLPLQRTKYRIEPNGARDEVTEHVAKDLGLPIDGADEALPKARTKGRFSWAEHVEQSLSRLEYGHAVFEQVYFPPDANGRVHLRKLAPRPQDTIAQFITARDGGLVKVIQHVPAGTYTVNDVVQGGVPIPVSRLVVYVHKKVPGKWMGRSLLRPAYKHVLLKDELLRIEAVLARRNGVGIPHVKAGANDDAAIKRAVEIASNFRAAERGGIGTGPDWDVNLIGVNGALPNLRPMIEGHDKAISIAGLAHFLNLDGKGGSYALASVQSDTFVQSEQTEADYQCLIGTAHIVEDIVDLNWGEDEPAPRIVCDEIGTRQDATAAGLKMLVDAKLLSPDVLVERRVRQQMGLPTQIEPVEDDDGVDDEPEPTEVVSPVAASRGRGRKRAEQQDTLW
ncbi:phage portal protein family protein [Williamsia sp.]|uniref:phage portal protein family protein n=1 Tax=Williamsia sp. TaxID=1872085 RepID=UPI002F923039